jgi:hypothetical protein
LLHVLNDLIADRAALDWVLFEQTSHEGRVEVRADLNDFVSAEPTHPTVPVVKPETVLSACEGAQFHYGPISAYQCVLNPKLRTLWLNLRQFLESVGQKIRFAPVIACERMSSLYRPIDIFRNVCKELTTVASDQAFENVMNPGKSY